MDQISGFNTSPHLEFEMNDLAVLSQKYWAVKSVIGSGCCEELDGESRPLKQLRNNSNYTSRERSILSERKRREKVSHRFLALSALLPQLTKMDRASILEEAINYIRQLQDKVKSMEKKIMSKKKCYSNERCSSVIEARSCNSEVLIRIHCERRKGVLENCVGEIEKLHLSLASTSVVPFGDSALNITVIAQMEEEYRMSMNEVVNNLRVVLKL